MKLGGQYRIRVVVDFFSRGCYSDKTIKTLSVLNNSTRVLYVFQYDPESHYCCFRNFFDPSFIGMSFLCGIEIISEKEKYNLLGVGD